MRRLRRNRTALSNVVSTLIILVVSVLLAGVVTMYATNISSTRTQQEALKVGKQAVWVYNNGTAYVALAIDNVGGRDVVIDKIQVRGVEVSWSKVYYTRLNSSISTSLNCPSANPTWSNFEYTSGQNASFSNDTNDKPLASGDTMIIYIKNPDGISISDVGVTIGITVFTRNAQYYVECNVETAETA